MQGNRVSFRVKYFRIHNSWRQLDPINAGYVEADPAGDAWRIHYYLNYTRSLIAVSALVLLLGRALLAFGSRSALEVIGIMAAAWVWLFGMNFLTSVFMFRFIINRALKGLRAGIG